MPSVLDPPGVRDWDRQRDEPTNAWFAFKRWRDLQPTPTYKALAEEMGVTGQTITKWSHDWSWKVRKLAFDRHVSSGDADAARVTSETLAATHLTAAALAREAAVITIKRLLNQGSVDPKAITASAAARLLDIATRLERLTLSLPTEIVQDGADYSKLSDEEFQSLVDIQGKAGA